MINGVQRNGYKFIGVYVPNHTEHVEPTGRLPHHIIIGHRVGVESAPYVVARIPFDPAYGYAREWFQGYYSETLPKALERFSEMCMAGVEDFAEKGV